MEGERLETALKPKQLEQIVQEYFRQFAAAGSRRPAFQRVSWPRIQ